MIEAGGDSARRFSSAKEERRSVQLAAVTHDVHAGRYSDRLTAEGLCELHRRLFQGVRGHAGRMRRRGDGTERLVFGPNRSSHRDDVEREVKEAFRTLDRKRRPFHDHPVDDQYVIGAVHVSAWIHAEIVRIHPFEDGNGRSSRLVMNTVLVRSDCHRSLSTP